MCMICMAMAATCYLPPATCHLQREDMRMPPPPRGPGGRMPPRGPGGFGGHGPGHGPQMMRPPMMRPPMMQPPHQGRPGGFGGHGHHGPPHMHAPPPRDMYPPQGNPMPYQYGRHLIYLPLPPSLALLVCVQVRCSRVHRYRHLLWICTCMFERTHLACTPVYTPTTHTCTPKHLFPPFQSTHLMHLFFPAHAVP